MTQAEELALLRHEVAVLREAINNLSQAYSTSPILPNEATAQDYIDGARRALANQQPPASAEVLDEAREVLRQLRESLKPAQVVQYTPNAEDLEQVRQAVDNLQPGTSLPIPSHLSEWGTAIYKSQGTSLVTRLLWLLDLSPDERNLVQALAKWPSDADSLSLLADWCEENSRTATGEQFRRLIPQSGDVLVFRYNRRDGEQGMRIMDRGADQVRAHLARHGKDVFCCVLLSGAEFDPSLLPADTLRKYGLVRQAEVDRAVLEEREACAEICSASGDSLGVGQRLAEVLMDRTPVAS